jgi:hypothetical protein
MRYVSAIHRRHLINPSFNPNDMGIYVITIMISKPRSKRVSTRLEPNAKKRLPGDPRGSPSFASTFLNHQKNGKKASLGTIKVPAPYRHGCGARPHGPGTFSSP